VEVQTTAKQLGLLFWDTKFRDIEYSAISDKILR
jgi:hypothetical protein